jgi:hypothetical protein
MLGKQRWRLIEHPDSLCARVLKGRYFHDSDFLTTRRKKHSSHTWRTILAGREVLQKGLIRRVGDGSTTRIWLDRWIPNHFNGRPIVTNMNAPVTMVADLLTPSGAWNTDLIKQVFVDADAHAILSTQVRGLGAMSGPGSLRDMVSIRLSQHINNSMMSNADFWRVIMPFHQVI